MDKPRAELSLETKTRLAEQITKRGTSLSPALLNREQSLASADSSDLRDLHYQSEDLIVVASVDGCDDNRLAGANLADANLPAPTCKVLASPT